MNVLAENKPNGAMSLTRLVLFMWIVLLMVAFFGVLLLVVFSPVVVMNDAEVFKYEWDRFAGAFTFGSVTFGALVVQYLGKKVAER